jgi:hypothetical protein
MEGNPPAGAIGEKFDNRELPTLILLKNGEEASRLKEGFSYAELLKWTEGVLQTESSPRAYPEVSKAIREKAEGFG